MRARLLVVVLASALALGSGLGFASDPTTTSGSSASQPPVPEEPETEVLAKVVEPSPVKDVVEVDAMPRTGNDSTGVGVLVGLVLVGLGLAAIDVTGWSRTRRERAAWRREWARGPWHTG